MPDINWDNQTIRTNVQYLKEINKKMLEILTKFNPVQALKETTRKSNNLGIRLATCPDLTQSISVFQGMSDHDAVLSNWN